MPKFIEAKDGPKDTVIYKDTTGKEFIFSGGTRTWRNHNPGNLVPGNISKKNGAIGKAGKFAVFPDYETGHQAHIDCLKTTYGDSDIRDLVENYAPKGENNVKNYTAFLKKKTGVAFDKKVKDFTSEEFEKLWKAIEQMEGQSDGTIKEATTKKKISGIKKNKKGTIIAYFIEGMGWISKSTGISLARKGQTDAVIARSRSGNLYLRTRPDKNILNNLEAMG